MPELPRRGRPRATDDKTQQNTIRALDRAMALLHHLARGEGLTLTRIAAIADEAPATAYRMLTTLAQHRLVELDEGPQLWHIGPGAFRLGAAFAARTDLGARAEPAMADLLAKVAETVTLSIPDDGELMILRQAECRHALRARLPLGLRLPLHACASGKALLAFAPGDSVAALLERGPLKALTAATITNPALLRADLSGARKQGFASDDQEYADGLRAVAAPVFGPQGAVVATLAISAPLFRMGPGAFGTLGQQVAAAATRITLGIGGSRGEAGKSPD